jgi:hypothetical protein
MMGGATRAAYRQGTGTCHHAFTDCLWQHTSVPAIMPSLVATRLNLDAGLSSHILLWHGVPHQHCLGVVLVMTAVTMACTTPHVWTVHVGTSTRAIAAMGEYLWVFGADVSNG